MRVLIACGVSQRREGGVASVVYHWAEELRALGHSVDCLFSEDLLPQRSLPRRFETLDLAWQIARRIAATRADYDVVNIQAPLGFLYGFARKLRGPSYGPPYVMTMHGLEERRIHAMSREAAMGRTRHFRLKNRLWQGLYHMPTYRYSIRTADCSIVLNREAWFFVQLKYGTNSGSVWYIPNGVDPRYFVPRDNAQATGNRLLFVGTWIDHKGIYYLSEGFSLLSRENPELKLTVAGCQVNAEEVKESFPEDVRARVDVIPFVTVADMPSVYAAHDIFLFPSLMEGMPLVLLEAMASGLPVVTTDSCGMGDAVEDGYNGLLVKPADTAGLVAATRRLIRSPQLREQLGHRAKETMRRYTWDQIARRVEEVLTVAVHSSRNRGLAGSRDEKT